jgi:hypothetical protein
MSIEVEWARMTAPDLREIAARAGALAILPAGSLEQHGPHLPVITDTASAFTAAWYRYSVRDNFPRENAIDIHRYQESPYRC